MIKKLKPKTEFGRNVFTLMIGTTAAQAIPIAISPILTRIYSPEEFGLFALYMSIVALLSVAATGRYELAVMLPKSDADADALVILSGWITVIFSLCIFMIVFFCNESITQLLGNPEISPWLYMVPFSILFMGFYNTLNFWLNRHKRYSTMSKNRVAQSVITGSGQLSMGMVSAGAGGLIVSVVLGQLLATLLLFKQFFFQPRQVAIEWQNLTKAKELASHYKNHPCHLLPAQWLGVVAIQLPIFIISGAFGAVATGFYSIAQRLISLPTFLVANAIGDVYRQQATVEYQERGEFRSLFLKTIIKTTKIAIIPFLILYIIAPDLFAFVLGEKWRVAGEYARIITIASFFQFIFTPVDKGALIVGATTYIFYWQIIRFISLVSLLVISKYVNLSTEGIIWGVSIINISLYLVDGIIEFRLTQKKQGERK